jgi:hypothetical protein
VHIDRKQLLSIILVITLCFLTLPLATSYAATFDTPIKRISATITVTDPSGSTFWQNHEYHTIAWKSRFVNGNVKIEVWKDRQYHSTLVGSVSVGTEGVGSCKAYVGSAYSRSGKYQIKVISLEKPSIYGISPMFYINEKVF